MPKEVVFSFIFAATVAVSLCSGLGGPQGSVCSYKTSRTASRRVSSWEPYTKAILWWKKTKFRKQLRLEWVTVWDQHEKCCSGYRNTSSVCEPICDQGCKIGRCVRPNTCEYDSRHTFGNDDSGCEPFCKNLCTSAKCTAPVTCPCNEGYQWNPTSNSCKPVCDSTCEHGWCDTPNKCACDAGYTLNDNNRCIAMCKSGFLYNETTKNCDPVCAGECINGVCAGPDTCECLEGYSKSVKNSSICTIHCENCANGFCVKPNECKCNDGFFKDDAGNGNCIPNCDIECIHGRCTALGCVCSFGWKGESCDEPKFCVVVTTTKNSAEDYHESNDYTSATLSAEASTKNTIHSKVADINHISSDETEVTATEATQTFTSRINMETVIKYSEIKWDGPSCAQMDSGEIDRTFIHTIWIGPNETQHFFVIDLRYGSTSTATTHPADEVVHSSGLRGRPGSVCVYRMSHKESRSVSYLKPRISGAWFWKKTHYHTEWKWKVNTVWNNHERCCSGYMNTYSVCKPICDQGCTNGRCVRPNTCECNSGYVATTKYECIPSCNIPCTHGKCTAPNMCTCDNGYERVNVHTCKPICQKPCINGRCARPGYCECHHGYTFGNDNSICEPVCTNPCTFGRCTAPETCTCNEGYQWNPTDNSCEPVCDSTCEHGWCDTPNKCACDAGYTLNDNNQCIAVCRSGFLYNETTKNCDPVCAEECINGVCAGPDTCECLEGYSKSVENSSICTIDCENCANGFCVKPNECVCNDGFFKNDAGNGNCIRDCDFECIHGRCTALGCVCSFGWEGESCYEPKFCVIVTPTENSAEDHHESNAYTSATLSSGAPTRNTMHSSVTDITDISSEAGEVTATEAYRMSTSRIDMEAVIEYSEIKWDGPSCEQMGFGEIDRTSVHTVWIGLNETQHFFVIDMNTSIALRQ